MKPQIDGTDFGSITIAGARRDYDVVIRLNGDVEQRQKILSKLRHGMSHTVSLEEARHIFEAGARRLIVGCGQNDCVELSADASRFFADRGCAVHLLPTPRAAMAWNAADGAVIGMFHVTC